MNTSSTSTFHQEHVKLSSYSAKFNSYVDARIQEMRGRLPKLDVELKNELNRKRREQERWLMGIVGSEAMKKQYKDLVILKDSLKQLKIVSHTNLDLLIEPFTLGSNLFVQPENQKSVSKFCPIAYETLMKTEEAAAGLEKMKSAIPILQELPSHNGFGSLGSELSEGTFEITLGGYFVIASQGPRIVYGCYRALFGDVAEVKFLKVSRKSSDMIREGRHLASTVQKLQKERDHVDNLVGYLAENASPSEDKSLV